MENTKEKVLTSEQRPEASTQEAEATGQQPEEEKQSIEMRARMRRLEIIRAFVDENETRCRIEDMALYLKREAERKSDRKDRELPVDEPHRACTRPRDHRPRPCERLLKWVSPPTIALFSPEEARRNRRVAIRRRQHRAAARRRQQRRAAYHLRATFHQMAARQHRDAVRNSFLTRFARSLTGWF